MIAGDVFISGERPLDLMGLTVDLPAGLVEDTTRAMADGRFDGVVRALASVMDSPLSQTGFYTDIFSDGSDMSDPHHPVIGELGKATIERVIDSTSPELRGLPHMSAVLRDMHIDGVVRSITSTGDGFLVERRLADVTDADLEDFTADMLRKVLTTSMILGAIIMGPSDHQLEYVPKLDREKRRNPATYGALDAFLGGDLYVDDEHRISSAADAQPHLEGLLTTNRVVVTRDVNYRRLTVNEQPHNRALYPVQGPLPSRHVLAGRDAWASHIETGSTNDAPWLTGGQNSLSFMRTIYATRNGRLTNIEQPCIMIADDIYALMRQNVDLYEAVLRAESWPTNHDLFHNVQPVFSHTFMMHQLDMPMTFGGYHDAYNDFGTQFRRSPVDYEYAVGRLHIEALDEHFKAFPESRQLVYRSIQSVFNDFITAKEAGAEPAVIAKMAEIYATRILKMFAPSDEIFDRIAEDLAILLPDGLAVDPTLLTDIVAAQEGVDIDTTASLEQIYDDLISQLPTLPTPTRSVVSGLMEIGAFDSAIHGRLLHGVNRLRWTAVNLPLQDDLKGHIEKVHGSSVVRYGEDELPPLEIIREQHRALQAGSELYNHRLNLLKSRQELLYGIYSQLTADGAPSGQRSAVELVLDRAFVAALDHETWFADELAAVDTEDETYARLLKQSRDYFVDLSAYETQYGVSIAAEKARILAQKRTNPE